MSVGTAEQAAPAARADLSVRTVNPARRLRNTVATVLIWLSLAVAVIPLAFVIYYVVKEGLGIMSWGFLTADIPRVRATGPGMGPAVAGTLVITGAATLMAVPLGILGAVYVNEYGARNRVAAVIRFLSDVMAGVPSIVMGLFIYVLFVVGSHLDVGPVHLFAKLGQSGWAGALALACLMLPIVIRSTETMLKLVPADLREAAYALGTSKSRTIATVVLPAALPGIVSGALLAVARAAGETAPILFTVGAVAASNWKLSGPNTTLSAQIFANAAQPFPGAQQRAWGAALTLIALVVILSILARVVARRFTVR